MTRTVFCTKYQEELEALDFAPMPGAKGQALFETVSKKAWQAWLSHQTMLINEKHLSMMDLTDRTYLGEQMTKFLSGDNYDQADGFVPEKND